MGTEEALLERLREIPLETRLQKCGDMVGRMRSERRPPHMSVPVQWDDEDQYISITCDDALVGIVRIKAEVERLRSALAQIRDLDYAKAAVNGCALTAVEIASRALLCGEG